MGTEITDSIITHLSDAYSDPGINAQTLKLVHEGKYANANTYRFQSGGKDLILKEFYSRCLPLRLIVGRVLVGREFSTLSNLAGIHGVPGEVKRIGPYAFAMEYVDGEMLSLKRRRGDKLPRTFFIELEKRVEALHQAGYVHLELRNFGNIICTSDGHPYLIDFQSSFKLAQFPTFLRNLLIRIDRSGVYKVWSRLSDTPLDSDRQKYLDSFRRLRRLWFFRGYRFSKKVRKARAKFKKVIEVP